MYTHSPSTSPIWYLASRMTNDLQPDGLHSHPRAFSSLARIFCLASLLSDVYLTPLEHQTLLPLSVPSPNTCSRKTAANPTHRAQARCLDFSRANNNSSSLRNFIVATRPPACAFIALGLDLGLD